MKRIMPAIVIFHLLMFLSLIIMHPLVLARDVFNHSDPDWGNNWVKEGFEKSEIEDWNMYDFSPLEAKMWKENGINPRVAFEWKGIPVKAPDAKLWSHAGFSPDDARLLLSKKINIEEALEWKKNGLGKEIVEWKELGFNVKSAAQWKSSNFDSYHARQWTNEGFTDASEVLQWKSAEFDAPNAKNWKECGFTAKEYIEWKQSKLFSPSEMCDWKATRLGLSDVTKWKQAGFTPSEVVSCVKSKATLKDAIKQKSKKLSKFGIDTLIAKKELAYIGQAGPISAMISLGEFCELLSIGGSEPKFDNNVLQFKTANKEKMTISFQPVGENGLVASKAKTGGMFSGKKYDAKEAGNMMFVLINSLKR